MPVDKHGHRCGNAMSATFLCGGKASGTARFASERAPTGQDELAQEHDMGLAREGGFAAMRENFCWEKFTPRLGLRQRCDIQTFPFS